MRSLQSDLNTDLQNIKFQLSLKETSISDYTNALEILSNKKHGTKEDLNKYLKAILEVAGVTLNKTTFNNLQTTGEIRLIKNKTLADSIVGYYNTGYIGWETALRDYTRNQIGPYFMNFDFLPQQSFEYKGFELSYYGKAKDFDQPEKTLQDYKNDFFIINGLRQKLYNLQGLKAEYIILKDYAEKLNKSIDDYLKDR